MPSQNYCSRRWQMTEITGPVVVGASRLSTFRDCHEKDRLRYVELLVPKQKETKRSFGTAFHAAVETYYNTESIEESERAFVKIAKESDMPVNMDEDDARTQERGIALFHAWLEKWQHEPFKLVRGPDGKPYTEKRFSIHLFDYRGHPVLYSGTIDYITEAGGRIYIPDVKTTRRSLSSFQKSMRPNHALTGYYVGAKTILGDRVFAVGYDAIFISERKPNPKKGGWWAFGIDIEKDFMRSFTTRSQTDVDVWYDLVCEDTMDLIRCMESGREPWSMNAPTACWRYGRCEYLDICFHNRDKIVIESGYTRSEWHTITDTKTETEEPEDA
jgi:hypothetical protein